VSLICIAGAKQISRQWRRGVSQNFRARRKAFPNPAECGSVQIVDNDSAEIVESTEMNRAWTGTPLPTLRRERLTRRRMLEEIEGDSPCAQIPLDKEETVIGRAPDAQIRLASKKASRHHAFFRLRGTDCVMVDNDSHNGVLLNGVNVHSAVLRDGDVIHVADSVFVYRED
jgi:hypothetical protein